MERMKIIYVYAGFDWGMGGEQRLLALSKGLSRAKFDISICVIENAQGGLGPDIVELGCPIYELNLSRRFFNPFVVLRVVLGFYRFFKKHRPHIVHTQSVNANVLGRIAAKLAGVPIVVSTDNAPAAYEIRRAIRVSNRIINILLDRFSDTIIVASEEILKTKTLAGTPIQVISTPVNLENLYAMQKQIEREPFSSTNPVIGVVGRLSTEKGQKFLIAAMPEILKCFPSARLLIVGDGPLERELKAQVNALKLNHCIEFTGYVPHSVIFAQWARMDIAVVPSLNDARPIVTLEAMAIGLPVVGSNVGGISEVVIDGKTGIIVPPKDSTALAQAIKYLLSHPNEAVDMGLRGKERAFREFHPSKFIEAHENIYEGLVKSHVQRFGGRALWEVSSTKA
jgi:glycosyltransferase involved in cell wall biosynthesis